MSRSACLVVVVVALLTGADDEEDAETTHHVCMIDDLELRQQASHQLVCSPLTR